MTSIEVVKHSEHGLGQYRSPTGSRGWIEQIWGWVIEQDLGRSPPEPQWFGLPLVSRLAATSPALLKPLAPLGVRPFSFMMSAYVRPFGHPVGTNPEDIRVVAPFEADPGRWLDADWRNAKTGEPVSVTTDVPAPHEVGLKTYRDLAEEYGHRPEVSAAGQDSYPCRPTTTGRLERLDVHVPQKDWIGKEANNLELLDAGLVTSPDEICQTLGAANRVPDWMVKAMHRHPAHEIASAVGISERYVKMIRNRRRTPSPELSARLIASAATSTALQN